MDKIDLALKEVLLKQLRADEYQRRKNKRKSYTKYENLPYLEVIVTGEPQKEPHENIDNLKFPAYCLFRESLGEEKKLGVINGRYQDGMTYYLHDCSRQYNDLNTNYLTRNLVDLFERHDIEIVKVKIIARRG